MLIIGTGYRMEIIMKYKVVEIFDSIDGEGIRTGMPATFIRLAGCNLRCSYCDTLYALFGEAEECRYVEMTKEEIIKRINPNYKRVTLTGGEPLIADGIAELIGAMTELGFEVNVETNGAADISKIKRDDNLFFTIDYKLPSSDVEDKMLWDNFLKLSPRDVIKFVVGSSDDAEKMISVVGKLKNHYDIMPNIFIGAVYGSFSLRHLTEIVLSESLLKDARIQIQLHKIIWSPEERGV